MGRKYGSFRKICQVIVCNVWLRCKKLPMFRMWGLPGEGFAGVPGVIWENAKPTTHRPSHDDQGVSHLCVRILILFNCRWCISRVIARVSKPGEKCFNQRLFSLANRSNLDTIFLGGRDLFRVACQFPKKRHAFGAVSRIPCSTPPSSASFGNAAIQPLGGKR